MSLLVVLIMEVLLVGLVMVASNPSPYFAALGLVLVSATGCGLLVLNGAGFLSMVLFLIYLGGMLVVFAYSSALASEVHPETYGSPRVALNALAYGGAVVLGGSVLWEEWMSQPAYVVGQVVEGSAMRGELGGVGMMYSSGGPLLVVGAWGLLLTLFVVLEVVRGGARGALRAV